MAKVGRPTKYKPEYCDELIEFMGDYLSPCSFDSFAGKIGINQDTLYEWAKVHKEFSEAKKLAESRGKYVREDRYNLLCTGLMRSPKDPTKHVKAPSVNQAMLIFAQKNQSGWKDKVEISEYDEVDELEFFDPGEKK